MEKIKTTGQDRRDYVEKWLTPAGIKTLETRLKSLVRIFNETPDGSYPLEFRMYGFPNLKIKTPNDLIGRINELGDLIDIYVEVNLDDNSSR